MDTAEARSLLNVTKGVVFGRGQGEQSLGTIIKVNRKTVKIRLEEDRGNGRASTPGATWKVTLDFCRAATGDASDHMPPAPTPRRRVTLIPAQNGATFAAAAAALGLPTDCLGKTIILGRSRRFTITAIKLSRPAYPVSATGAQGGRYRLSVEDVLAGLERIA